MPSLMFPEWRLNVIEAIKYFVAAPQGPVEIGVDLDNAVHWLIDDTFWDLKPMADDIGYLLWNETELEMVSPLVSTVISILDDIGPHSTDEQFLAHPRARTLNSDAEAAIILMTRNDREFSTERSDDG